MDETQPPAPRRGSACDIFSLSSVADLFSALENGKSDAIPRHVQQGERDSEASEDSTIKDK